MCKISIIIPVYNGVDCLRNTLRSIIKQRLADIEIICINDGSIDDTERLIKEIQKNDDRIKYVYQENQGAAVARNKGMELAKGEYIAFMDADDLYPNIYSLESLYNAAVNNGAVISGGSLKTYNREEKKGNKRFFDNDGYIEFSDYQFDLFFGRFIFKRSFIIEKNIFFPILRVYEDPLFLSKALYEAKKFYAIKDEVYYYSGVHQVNEMSEKKVEDYLKGIIEELRFSSYHQLDTLHRSVWERLEHQASYYAEQYVYQKNLHIFSLLLQANEIIDRKLLGLSEDYMLPVIVSLFDAGNKYVKLINKRGVSFVRRILSGNINERKKE